MTYSHLPFALLKQRKLLSKYLKFCRTRWDEAGLMESAVGLKTLSFKVVIDEGDGSLQNIFCDNVAEGIKVRTRKKFGSQEGQELRCKGKSELIESFQGA